MNTRKEMRLSRLRELGLSTTSLRDAYQLLKTQVFGFLSNHHSELE
jgi:hypothetical protein